MGTLHQAFEGHVALLEEGLRSERLGEAAQRMSRAADRASQAEWDAVLDGLEKIIRSTEIERASHTAIMAGCLVGLGATPEIAGPAMLERLMEILLEIQREPQKESGGVASLCLESPEDRIPKPTPNTGPRRIARTGGPPGPSLLAHNKCAILGYTLEASGMLGSGWGGGTRWSRTAPR
ncbi:MAG TPA: hypothetical protein VE981_18420 [Planctomycetota bacterium]|nr:hypothetical protein [Planctomycetota bacterium]